ERMEVRVGFGSGVRMGGGRRYEGMGGSILVIGPACVLTHGTAGLSFIALLFSDSDLIRTFGEAGLIACIIALVAVLTLVPLLGVLLVRRGAAFVAQVKGADFAGGFLTRLFAWVAAPLVRHARPFTPLPLLVGPGPC